MASLKVLILDNFVSQGTLGMQSRSEEKALLIDCVRRRSFLLLPGTMGWCRLLLLLLLLSFDFLAELLLLAEVDEADEAIKALELDSFDSNGKLDGEVARL